MLERWERPRMPRERAVPRYDALPATRVLLVEDEPGIVDFVRRGLEATGFAVEVAFDGIEGERLALSESFDAIVLDLMLPGRSGLEILAAVRSAKSNVPVIVLTARGEIEDRVAGLDAGAVDYLVKPFSMAELVARVRAQLRAYTQTSTTTLSAEGIEANLLTRRVQPRRQNRNAVEHRVRAAGAAASPSRQGALARADPQLGVGL